MKVLVIRLSSIGDIVLTTALLRCLHEQVPQVEIHYLTRTSNMALLRDNPYVAKVHGTNVTSVQLRDLLREEQFDFVADLQGNRRSRTLCRLLHVRHASYNKQDLSRMLLVLTKHDWTDHRPVAERYFDAVKALGVHPDGKGLECYYETSDIAPLLEDRHHRRLPADYLETPYVAIAVGSQHLTKQVPLDKLQVLCSYLSCPVVLLGDNNDKRRLKNADIRFHDNVLNLCGKTTLEQSMQLIDHAAVLLTGDSGMMHIAAALQTPTIVVWGSTVPAFGFAPYKMQAANMEVDLWCRPCHRFGRSRCPRGNFECMENHEWQKIAKAINNMINTQQ